jgi:hypothetical protein
VIKIKRKYEMGIRYFKLDNTIETHEKLIQFFIDMGFNHLIDKPLGNEMFNRVSTFTDDKTLTFDVIWFKNLAHLRFGKWGESFVEVNFNEIIGSYLPNCDHETLDFLYEGKRVCLLSKIMEE